MRPGRRRRRARLSSGVADETNLSSRIDLLGRSGAILAVRLYGAGLTIVSLYDARFGISAFEIFKPKIFAAGFAFVGLTTAATLAAGRVFNVLWWEGSLAVEDKQKESPQSSRRSR